MTHDHERPVADASSDVEVVIQALLPGLIN